MRRRRGGAKSASRSPEMSKQATSPETRLRRPSTRAASLTPSKPTRRHPTEALHMTTRAAGKAASQAGTDSTANSEASGSRRSSLNDAQRAADDADVEHEHEQTAPNSSQSSEPADAAELQQRQQDADRSAMDVDEPAMPDSETSSQDRDQDSLDTSKSGNKRKRSSVGEDLSQEHSHTNGVNGSSSPDDADDPPAPPSRPEPEQPPRKRQFRGGWRGRGRGRGRGGRGGLTLSTHASFQTDATSTPPSAGLPDRDGDHHHLSEDQQGESERPTKQPKRLPGRRRAPNADPSIEADLRRQLQLKTAYRAVVKVLKPVLAELADRSINDVEDDPVAHQKSDQHEAVKNALDTQLSERVAYLNRKFDISKEHVERRKTAELEIAKTEFENVFFQLQEDYIMRCQYQLLNILREADKATQDGYATDDEDGLVPRRRGMQYKWKPMGFLDPKSDSRSRFFLETEKLWNNRELRDVSKKERNEFLDKNSEDFNAGALSSRDDFATYDADHREYALAVFNASTLAHAAEAIENNVEPPMIIKPLPNEDATGLQLLISAMDSIPPAPLPRIEEQQQQQRQQKSEPRSTPAFESIPVRVDSVPPRATSTPKSTRGRRRGPSARSTPIRAPARSGTSTPVPGGPDESFEATEPGSALSASMSMETDARDSSPRKTTMEPTPVERTPDEPLPTIRESPKPAITGVEREVVVPEPQPPRQPSVLSNRITDLLNKGDEPAHPQISSFVSSSPVGLPPAILQPLHQPSSTPSAPPTQSIEHRPHTAGQLSEPSHPSLPAQLSQPVDYSERARESQISTLSEPDQRIEMVGSAQERPTTAPAEQTRAPDAVPSRKTFWDTITIGSKSRPTSPPNADKTPLARIRQILNPSNYPRKTESPSRTTPPATATSSNDRSSERPEMAPPASRASVPNDSVSSRRSSGAASAVSQPASAQPAVRSPAEAPKRSNSRDTGLEQRQNRWRAAVPPQHGPTPPFRPDSNPPQNAFLKHQGWTAESQARLSQQQSAASPPQAYPSYAPPYDSRSLPPAGYAPSSTVPPPPPPPGPYNQNYPQPNPHLSAVPFVSPPFTCPPGPPPYQSIYAPPGQGGYPPQPGGYAPPPPPNGAPPPPHQQQQPPPPPPPPGAHQQQHFGPQYGGQPILPATVDRRGSGAPPGGQGSTSYPGSPPQHHPPAFSQQQNQYGGNGGNGGHSDRRGGGHGGRRRWKNQAPGTEFRPYTGPKRH